MQASIMWLSPYIRQTSLIERQDRRQRQPTRPPMVRGWGKPHVLHQSLRSTPGRHLQAGLCIIHDLLQRGEFERGVQWVGERHPVEHGSWVKVLAQDHAHLPQAGDGPNLGVVVGEQVLSDAPQGLEHHRAGERDHREGQQEAFDLAPYRLGIRPGLKLPQAGVGELGERLRRQSPTTGAAYPPEHLPSPISLERLPAVHGVDQKVRVEDVTGSHTLPKTSCAVLVELLPIEAVSLGKAVGLGHPVGLLQEVFQGLHGASPGKPTPRPFLLQHQTVQQPTHQLGLGDPELSGPRLQRPLVLVAYVQLLSEHVYIIYITQRDHNLDTGPQADGPELKTYRRSGRVGPVRIRALVYRLTI